MRTGKLYHSGTSVDSRWDQKDLQMGDGEHKEQRAGELASRERCRQQHLTDDSWHLITPHLPPRPPPPTIESRWKWIKKLPTGNRSEMHAEAWTRGFCGYVIGAAQRVSSYVVTIAQFIVRSLTQSKHDYSSPLKPINFLIQRDWGWSASHRYTGKTAWGSDRERYRPEVTFTVMQKSFRSPIR